MRDFPISRYAHRQLHSFLDELKNGTRNYRSLSSLDQHVAQEYRGRCLIELLQNAHDALREAPVGDSRSITFLLLTSPVPVLCVANSGIPFQPADFEGICQLGQSPKVPNASVGNKGLGFRSVLEICTTPEVWSIPSGPDERAFWFCFHPSVLDRIADVLEQLRNPVSEVRSPFAPSQPLVDWSDETRRLFATAMAQRDGEFVREVRDYLSPYQFPLEHDQPPPEVRSLWEQGHSTVIRLPLDGGRNGTTAEAVGSLRQQFEDLSSEGMIFLEHARQMSLDLDGDIHTFTRNVTTPTVALSDGVIHQQVRIEERRSGGLEVPPRTFDRWQSTLGGKLDPAGAQEIRDLVRHLPNRWPEVHSATIGIATEQASRPTQGFFVIFLPTTISTGTGAFINAPFFGSLNRRFIDFDDRYNALLWKEIVRLIRGVVRSLISGPAEEWRARAVVDLIGSTAVVNGLSGSILSELNSQANAGEVPLRDESLILTDAGWVSPGQARWMFAVPPAGPIPQDVWRAHATFPVAATALEQRREALAAIVKYFGGKLDVQNDEFGTTIERMGQEILAHRLSYAWPEFLDSVLAILPDRLRAEPRSGIPDPLRKVRFLPVHPEKVICADDAAVFFQPDRGAEDAAEFVGDVPPSLAPKVAFLRRELPMQEGPQGQNTSLQRFLDKRLVHSFGRKDLLQKVVEPAIPELPVAHDSAEALLCADLLGWAAKIVSREFTASLAPLIRRLPVPCHGGWYPLSEATFGPGWNEHHGDAFRTLANALPESEAAALLSRALLGPDHPLWPPSVPLRTDLLEAGGAVGGIRLERPLDSEWDSSYLMQRHDLHRLPPAPPPGFPMQLWTAWRNAAREKANPGHTGVYRYRLANVFTLPTLFHLDNFSPAAIRAYSELLLASFSHWPPHWRTVHLAKVGGQHWATDLESPLLHALRALPWFCDGGRPRPLAERWHIREPHARGQRDRFAHLNPISHSMARRLAHDSRLLADLNSLGLQTYPVESEQTGPQLLDALAAAWEQDALPPDRWDIFLSQVRHAWKHLHPEKGLPQRFLILRGKRTLCACSALELKNAYLPDHNDRAKSLASVGAPSLEIRPEDARRLESAFAKRTPLRRASQLVERVIIDGSPWEEAREGGVPLIASSYAWLPPVALAIAAYGGAIATGPETKVWSEAVRRLRVARLVYCETITLVLLDGEAVVADIQPPAAWLAGNVLAICRSVGTDHTLLAESLQSTLDRLDLLKTLRLVLGRLSGNLSPTPLEVERALVFAEIDESLQSDIWDRWAHSTNALVDRVRPVLKLLGISEEGLQAAQREESELAAWITAHVPDWPVDDLMQAARRSRDDAEMGRAAWCALGDAAQLPLWNETLRSLGERYVPVRNVEAPEQVDALIDQLSRSLRALLLHAAVTESRLERFREWEQIRAAWRPPGEWGTEWWDVPMSAVCRAIADQLAAAGMAESELSELRTAHSVEAFCRSLASRGIQGDVDPFDTAAENLRRLKETVGAVYDVYSAWRRAQDRTSLSPCPGVAHRLPEEAYVTLWNAAQLLQNALALLGDAGFVAAAAGCPNATELRPHLRLTTAEVERQQTERLQEQEEAARARRTFVVAGNSFELGQDRFDALFDQLTRDADPSGDAAVDPRAFTSLTRPAPAGGGGGVGPTSPVPSKSAHLRASPETRELVGIVGEIRAYHLLRQRFGAATVTRKAWVSEIRDRVLPPVPGEPDEASDSHGCDFRFRSGGSQWHIEVKATTGDEEEFEFGVRELELASRLAGTKSKPWCILRVRQALSDDPQFDWLPNPFESEYRHLFQLDTSGVRVCYRRTRS